jgi:putative polyhydroxyalkanoate system protein
LKISYEHHSTRDAVRAKLETAIEKALDLGGGRIESIDHAWEGDRLNFSFAAVGKTIKGNAQITDTEVVIDIGLPFMFRSFEGKVKSRILQALDEMFA